MIQMIQAGLEQQNASFNSIFNKLSELSENRVRVGIVETLQEEANLVRSGRRKFQHREDDEGLAGIGFAERARLGSRVGGLGVNEILERKKGYF